jgi:hypothetical protein
MTSFAEGFLGLPAPFYDGREFQQIVIVKNAPLLVLRDARLKSDGASLTIDLRPSEGRDLAAFKRSLISPRVRSREWMTALGHRTVRFTESVRG